jgi:hypothetical protein
MAEHGHSQSNETRYRKYNQDFIKDEFSGCCPELWHLPPLRRQPAKGTAQK